MRLFASSLFTLFCCGLTHAAGIPVTAPASSATPAASTSAPAAARAFGGKLSCAGLPSASMLDSVVGSSVDGKWTTDAMKRIGFPAALPSSGAQLKAALTASALLRGGHVVAAKMANDEAAAKVSGFGATAFHSSFETLLTALTQPVDHASYKSSVRAEGEVRVGPPHGQTHGVDLEESSHALNTIIARAAVAQSALGDAYAKPAIRYYILANGFQDEAAMGPARAQVCSLHLDAATINKLDVSARYMAMPGAVDQ